MSSQIATNVVANAQAFAKRAGHVIMHPIRQQLEDLFVFPRSNKAAQILLMMHYKELIARNLPLPTFEEVEFRAYSQFGEDGILLYLFALLGTTNKQCVELCGGGGYDNTANLIINHGWKGLFFDGCEQYLERGKRFYARCADTKVWPPQLVQAWITADNINRLLEEHDYTGEIDLLSLDMDGIDYWVWKAIEIIQPRVIILEFNTALGPEASLTIPYHTGFTTEANSVSALSYLGRRVVNTFVEKPLPDRIDHYYGASLAAFVKLGKEKGYRLVGSERYGYNAFFVRDGLGEQFLPEISPADCFKHPFTQYLFEVRRKTVEHKDWVEV